MRIALAACVLIAVAAVAVAAPHLGQAKASTTFHLPTTTSPSPTAPYLSSQVEEQPPVPLPVGSDPVLLQWSQQSSPSLTGTPVTGGVQLQLPASGEAQGYAPHNAVAASDIRVDGSVQFSSGADGNALGLGCVGPNWVPTYWFFIHDVGTWSFDSFPPDSAVVLLARGDSSSIRPTTGSNQLAVACTSEATGTRFQLAINGTPVANLFVKGAVQSWYPIVAACSPSGPDTAVFTNVILSTVG